MCGKIWVVETGKTIVNLESREFANKMSIFALIFRNSELPKADLLYKSPHIIWLNFSYVPYGTHNIALKINNPKK